MTKLILFVIVQLIYFGLLCYCISWITKKVLGSMFSELPQPALFSALLVVPVVIFYPLSDAIHQLYQVQDFFQLGIKVLSGKVALMLLTHLITSVLGILVLVIFLRSFVFKATENNNSDEKNQIIAILIAIGIALILFPFGGEIFIDLLPKTQLEGFR